MQLWFGTSTSRQLYWECTQTDHEIQLWQRQLSLYSNYTLTLQLITMPSVFWHCWFGIRKSIWPVKKVDLGTGVVICLQQGANDLHMVQLMPVPPYHAVLNVKVGRFTSHFVEHWKKSPERAHMTTNKRTGITMPGCRTLHYSTFLINTKSNRNQNVGQCPTWWPPWRIQVAPSVQRRKVWLMPLLQCHAVTLPRRETQWNLHRFPKLRNRSQPLVGRSSPYYQDTRRYCRVTSFFPIVDTCLSCKDMARQSCAMVPRWWLFCVLYLQRAACSTFRACILNLH